MCHCMALSKPMVSRAEVWTYNLDNPTQIKCFIRVELVLFELR